LSGLIIPDFKKEDYHVGTSPFEWLYQFRDNKLKMAQMRSIISEKAKAVGVHNFVTLFNCYLEMVEREKGVIFENATNFTGQRFELMSGTWFCDDFGIATTDKYGFEIVACNHPLMPTQRLINIDTNIEKLELAYRKGGVWRTIIADKHTLASTQSIIGLAKYGIAVNSENAKHIIKYLADIEHLNYEKLQEVNSIERLGWVDGHGFSPYVDGLVFDGELNFKHFFSSVSQKGSFDKWLEVVREIRAHESTQARIMLASSFASVLVEPLGALPFFVHLWGTTESGKTVALMLAASVWANPKLGEYIHSFNGTAVAQELSAGFVNSLPLILDELQIIKERKDFDQMIYQLTEGVGRIRGQKTGGLQKMQTWQNCILTSGECPINHSASGGGAINRVIEIECNDGSLFQDSVKVAETLKKHYGHAGKMFIEKLSEVGFDEIQKVQKEYSSKLSTNKATEKQALSASIILAADEFITKWIIQDGRQLTVDEIQDFLSTSADVSTEEKGFDYLVDTIAINSNKFMGASQYDEVWGVRQDDYMCVIKAKFDKILFDGGFNPASVLGWMVRNEKAQQYQGRNTKQTRIGRNTPRCVWVYMPDYMEVDEEVNEDEAPF